MGLTVKGFQGTISDVDMATQLGAHHAPTVRSAGDLAVTAVANARTVHVAAGVADAAFSKVTSDGASAADLALAPPASGGKWYAVTLDRQWSPTNSVTLRVDDLNVSDTNGTIPTTIPAGVVTALQSLPDQPGTASSTTGQRQLLAAVYVRAADTTLTIFDLRLFRTGAGTVGAPTLSALAVMASKFGDGAVISVGQHLTPGGYIHRSSNWTRTNGTFVPLAGADILLQGVSLANAAAAAADLAAYVAALSGLSLYQHTNWATIADIRHKWDGGVFRPWTSGWFTYTGAWGGLAGSRTASPGWQSDGRYRYTDGKVRYEFGMYINGGSGGSNGTISLDLPTACDTTQGPPGRYQDGYAVTGRAWRVVASNNRYYDIAVRIDSSVAKIYFGVVNSSQYMDSLGGLVQSDTVKGVLEYDPA